MIVQSASPETTRALGAALAKAITQLPAEQALVIALNGELGAGKTTFVGGLLHQLGITGPVRSPTYTLIEPYQLSVELDSMPSHVYHIDLYRLADASELEMLAPRDLLEPGAVLLVEWAERAGRALPTPDLSLTLAYPHAVESTERTLKIEAGSSTGRVLAASLHQVANEVRLSP
jgi:tRNA threonylcarbamoyladenosine biosynthesis protein TsaE